MSHRFMSARFKICSAGLSVVLVAISLGLSSRELERRVSWRALFRFFACIGTMNCPADVAQASSPASSPGVPPGVRVGGETPPQLAGGTPALQGGSWRASELLIETKNSRAHNAGQASRLSSK